MKWAPRVAALTLAVLAGAVLSALAAAPAPVSLIEIEGAITPVTEIGRAHV